MFRIRKVKEGWISEVRVFKYSFLGLHFWRVWRPFVKVGGLNSAWVAATETWAMDHLKLEVEREHVLR
jgi:hypothetical protein